MTLNDFASGKCNGACLLQQGVQTDQHARLGNDGRFLDLDHVAVLQSLDEIRLHIGVGLARSSCRRHHGCQGLDLLCDHIQNHGHTVSGGRIVVLNASQAFKNASRIKIHIIQIRKVHQLRHIGVVDAAH